MVQWEAFRINIQNGIGVGGIGFGYSWEWLYLLCRLLKCLIGKKKKNKFMYLFFDVETTGLPKNYKAPVSDLDNWPRVVQIAYRLVGRDGVVHGGKSHIIKPDGYVIPPDMVHGISHEQAMEQGIPLKDALKGFYTCLCLEYVVDELVLVAHNLSFDRSVAGAELLRCGWEDRMHGKARVCTMMQSTAYCMIQGKYGNKWPKLQELHSRLFGHEFAEAHDADADIDATIKCFFEMERLGLITIKKFVQ